MPLDAKREEHPPCVSLLAPFMCETRCPAAPIPYPKCQHQKGETGSAQPRTHPYQGGRKGRLLNLFPHSSSLCGQGTLSDFLGRAGGRWHPAA